MKRIYYLCALVFTFCITACNSNDPNNPTDSELEESYTLKTDNGRLDGKFSVSETKRVGFSQGNLQYIASSGTWRFAKYQWEIVGNNENSSISSTYSGPIDLFGWGTGNNPTKTSTHYKDYSSFSEWGKNAIINGGNKNNAWRTLTYDEWDYVLNTRENANKLRGQAKINNVYGGILLPDACVLPNGISFSSNALNKYSINEWAKLENAGAVFLPCGGRRYGTEAEDAGNWGAFWSSTPKIVSGAINGQAAAYCIHCTNLTVFDYVRQQGLAVRLVQDVN